MKRFGFLVLICGMLGCCPVSSYVGVYYNNHNGCEQVLMLKEDKTYKYLATYEGKKIEDYGNWEPSKAQGSCRIDIYNWEHFEPFNWGYEFVKKSNGINQLILEDNCLILNLDNSDYDLRKK